MQTIPLDTMKIPDGFYVYRSSLYRASKDVRMSQDMYMEYDYSYHVIELYHYEEKVFLKIFFQRVNDGGPKKIKITEYFLNKGNNLSLVQQLEVYKVGITYKQKHANFFFKKKVNRFHDTLKLRYNLM